MSDKKTLNVYQKLQKVRAELVDLNLKKTGKNTYSKFTYYELGDFLPSINKLNDHYGLMTKFNITKEKAILQIVDTDNPEERVTFHSETANVEIGKKDGKGGAQPIQNLGGKITYLRRYLLMVAYEIVEDDAVDAKNQNPETKTVHKEISAADIKKVNDAKDQEELAEICKKLRKKNGEEYQQSLVMHYTAKKEEFRAIPTIKTDK